MFGLGYQELLIILVIVLILFGANRLPQIARSLRSSLKEFKQGVNEAQEGTASATPPRADSPVSNSGERSCGQCKSPLAADWTHCPQCGTATAKPRT
jgi:sec-independent protein translocase protein TatA